MAACATRKLPNWKASFGVGQVMHRRYWHPFRHRIFTRSHFQTVPHHFRLRVFRPSPGAWIINRFIHRQIYLYGKSLPVR